MRRRLFCQSALVLTATPMLLHGLPVRAQTTQKSLAAEDAKIKPLLAKMTLDEKIGQMVQPELGNMKDEADIATYFVGSVLSGGGADPVEGNSLEAWTNTVDRLIGISRKTRLGIPILYGVDAVHGHNNVLGATVYPHNVGLGCTRNAKLVEALGQVTAEEVRATGIHWTFAPCVAVPRDDRWGRTYEGYSEDPAVVAELGAAAVRGMQHGGLQNPQAVLACAKHFVGDGGTTWGSTKRRDGSPGMDQGNTEVDEATLRRIHLPGYQAAVAAGVGSIMVSYSSWNGVKASGIKHLLTDVLKNELGFEGFLVSDYYAIGQIDRDYKKALEASINAGMDMAMEPAQYVRFITTLKELVNEGKVSMARIDDAVTRILRVKSQMGLLDAKRNQLADRKLHATFGGAAHRALARQAVRESLVLLKNDKQTLPLKRTAKRIHVAGIGADDIGMQCGGWTVEWQGQMGAVTPGGTTILQALHYASPKTKFTYAADGSGVEGADACVVVVGEQPYAEGVGDRADLSLTKEDQALVAKLQQSGVPLVLIVLSGRPQVLGDAHDKCAAVVAAWLPGTEGEGVADVLFGDHAPSGKLSFTWPRSTAQEPINVGDANYDPLYPFGHGLGYPA
ncbi:MAG TPA: glycoside hydrolase family 3 N-terminal domain-containing protein [Candidatus Acidoferrum sp.]|nr:glycoside hydrolase family 3 N-terminal domain-containing protein [Candidatus Acidoferrum sp.]